ncbi:hypothetical protein [Spirosoma litoris]
MKTVHVLFAGIFSLIVFGCKTQNDEITSTFDVVAQGIGGDCKLPLLDFGSRTAEVGALIGQTSPYKWYYAVNLDSTYARAGTSLQVTIRKTAASEDRACTTMGPAYPIITVTSVTAK